MLITGIQLKLNKKYLKIFYPEYLRAISKDSLNRFIRKFFLSKYSGWLQLKGILLKGKAIPVPGHGGP
jgi:hypothetical protein